MLLTEVTTISTAALPVAEFKAHLRAGTGFSEDTLQNSLLQSFLRAAMSAIEGRTGKALIERGFAWTEHGWRDPAGAVFPVAPVQSIDAAHLIDADGAETAVDPELFRTEPDLHRPVLRPRGTHLPSIPVGGAMRITFTAGMAADWATLPADLGHAILLLAAHYYEFRDETALGDGCMPFGVTSLIQRYRPMRLHLGAGQ